MVRAVTALFLIAVFLVVLRGRVERMDREAAAAAGPCPEGALCGTEAGGRGYVSPAELELDRAEVCPSAGYLCAGVEAEGSQRLLRWPDVDRVLTIEVTLPQGEPAARAVQLQRAAIRGILSWSGYPLRLRILDQPARGSTTPDIQVRWTDRLSENRLGQARTEWLDVGGRISFTVVDFSLVTRSPFDSRVELSAREIELSAAHEMGHALGIPHSDSERDVMYPENTASRLTARDYRTVEALYALPNGALIR